MLVVIDDDATILNMLKLQFETRIGAEFQVKFFLTGSDALTYIRANRGLVEACLVDFSLPGANGGEVSRQIKTIDANIYILMMSGFIDFSSAEPLLKERLVYQFFTKPLNMERLTECINTVTQLYLRKQAL